MARVDSLCLFAVWPPKVESVDELDQLLSELGRIERVEKRAQAALASKVATLTTDSAARLVVELPEIREADVPLSLADWRTLLEKAAEKFCNKNRAEILAEGRKSRKLNHGKIGWRQAGGNLVALEDFNDAGNPKILDALLKVLRQALLQLADFVVGGARFVEVKLSWRKKDLLKAFHDQEIGLAVVKKAGFEVSDEFDEFYLEALAGEVEALEG